MLFKTTLHIPQTPVLGCRDKYVFSGSCFSENIGLRMRSVGLDVCINPNGILFNPLSVAGSLRRIFSGKAYEADELDMVGDLYFSWQHHGSYKSVRTKDILDSMNSDLSTATDLLRAGCVLVLTWGTAYYYTLRSGGQVVANCHKQPSHLFEKVFAEPDEIVDVYQDLLSGLWHKYPQTKVILTISPVRHLKDGFIKNQQSKASLVLAAAKLVQLYEGRLLYFPAYEIVLDELRDYRFYAADMVHPAEMTIEYIWERFKESFFGEDEQQILKEAEEIARLKNHRPLFPESVANQRFEAARSVRIRDFSARYPYLKI